MRYYSKICTVCDESYYEILCEDRPNFKLDTFQIPVRSITIWASPLDINMMKWLIWMHTDVWYGTRARHATCHQETIFENVYKSATLDSYTHFFTIFGRGHSHLPDFFLHLFLEYSYSSVHIMFLYIFNNKTKPHVSTLPCEKFVEHDKHRVLKFVNKRDW